MEKMRDGMMSLNCATSISIHRDTYRLPGLRRAAFDKLGAMNNDVAPFLRVQHAQLTNFRSIMPGNMEQATVTDLSAHLRVKRRLIQDDVELVGFRAGHHSFDNRFGLQKVVAKK